MTEKIDLSKIKKYLLKHRDKILIIATILTLVGFSKEIYNMFFYNFFSVKSVEILDKSGEQATDFFLKLSGIKALVAIIEGSTINFGLGISGSVEFGDFIQPLYDFVHIIWKISLLNFVFINGQRILFQIGITKFFTPLLLIILGSYYFKTNDKVKNIRKKIINIFMIVYFLIPTYTYFAEMISTKVETFTVELHKNTFDDAISNLEEIEVEVSNLESISKKIKEEDIIKWELEGDFIKIPKANMNKELLDDISKDLKERVNNIKLNIEGLTKKFFIYFFSYLTLYLFNLLLIPLIFIGIIYFGKNIILDNKA